MSDTTTQSAQQSADAPCECGDSNCVYAANLDVAIESLRRMAA